MKLLTHLTSKERIYSHSITAAGRSSFKCISNRITAGDAPEQNIRLCLVPAHLASLTTSFFSQSAFFFPDSSSPNLQRIAGKLPCLCLPVRGWGESYYLMVTFTEMSHKYQRFCPRDPSLLSFVPSAPSLGHFPCKPASSGAQPGAEGRCCRWDTLDMGDTQQIDFSTTNREAQRQTANSLRRDVCAA